MTHTIQKRDPQKLNEVIENLDIQFGRTSDDVYTAYSTSEPLFCFDSHSPQHLVSLVTGALRSYAKVFYGLDIVAEARNVNQAQAFNFIPEGTLKPTFKLAA